MKKYIIEITEILQRGIEIEGESEEAVLKKVRELYEEEEIVLDSSDFLETTIEIVGKG